MIDYIQVFGLQSSGTNIITELMKANFDIDVGGKYGGKHGLRFRIDGVHSNVLFLYIHKNIFAWVCSVRDAPHKAIPVNLTVSVAIRAKWAIDEFSFDNLIEMRDEVLLDFYKIENQVDHWENLKHIWLFSNSENMLRSIQSKYSLPIKESFPNINPLLHYKGTGVVWKNRNEIKKYYLEKKYMDRLSEDDIDFIKNYHTLEERAWLMLF